MCEVCLERDGWMNGGLSVYSHIGHTGEFRVEKVHVGQLRAPLERHDRT